MNKNEIMLKFKTIFFNDVIGCITCMSGGI